jgi:hypothetical protein
MIFLQILLFFVSIVCLSVSISGYGKLLRFKVDNKFFLEIFFGFLIITFIITTFHFFLKIDFIFSSLVFILGLILFFKKPHVPILQFFKIKNISFLIVIFLFIPMFIAQKYHEDFGYYHLPYALGFLEEKIIFGYANIDKSYVYNSIWLNLYSIFFLENKSFNFLTLPSFILYLTLILFSLNQILSKNNKLTSDYFLIVVLFYFILKFTRISEFGVDLPSIIFSILGIYYFIKFFETNLLEERNIYFFLVISFSLFSVLIKLSMIPIMFLTVYLFFKEFKYLKNSLVSLRYLFIFLLFLFFSIQQFIYSGCFIFPNNFTCFNVNWFNSDYLDLSKQLELTNKSYYQGANKFYLPDEYLDNFNWLYFWIKRNFIEILEHSLTIIIPSLLFTFFQKKRKQNNFVFKEKVALYIFLFFGLIFWLQFSPVYRFAIHLFVTLIFISISGFFLSKHFSKKIFVIFIGIFILFSFSKNLVRLNKIDNVYLGIQKIDNKYLSNQTKINEFVKIFRPDIDSNSKNGWQGRLCWDIPFICSYNKLDVNKKNGYLIINKLKN